MNAYYDLFVGEILDSMDDWDFQGEVATADLVANQQEYLFPADILKIKRVEVSFDGVNWQKAEPLDINEIGHATDSTTIASHFNVSEPYFDLHDASLFLFPIPTSNVTGGLKIWYEKLITKLSAATDEPSFARPYHKGLAYGAAKDYFEKYLDVSGNPDKLVNADNQMGVYINRMKAFYRKKDQDRMYNLQTYDPGYDYGNDY